MDPTSSHETPAEPDSSTSLTGVDGMPMSVDIGGVAAMDGPEETASGSFYAGWDSAGQLLRAVRTRYGYQVSDVAETLRIRVEYLQAIETGSYAKLPGTVYALGFIRSYAAFLDLDAATVVRMYKSEIEDRTPTPAYSLPTPKSETRVPGGLMLLVSLIAGILAYGGWFYISSNGTGGNEPVSPVPDRLAALMNDTSPGADTLTMPRPARDRQEEGLVRGLPFELLPEDPDQPRRGSETIPLAALPDEIARTLLELEQGTAARLASKHQGMENEGTGDGRSTGALGDAGGNTGGTAADDVIVTTPPEGGPAQVVLRLKPGTDPTAAGTDGGGQTDGTADPNDALTPNGAAQGGIDAAQAAADSTTQAVDVERLYGQQYDQSRILLKAVADSWIQVKDSNGRQLFARLLRPGEAYRVPNRPGVRLKVGNAGGLIVRVDDIDLPPLGQSGQVIRNVMMDPTQLKERVTPRSIN